MGLLLNRIIEANEASQKLSKISLFLTSVPQFPNPTILNFP